MRCIFFWSIVEVTPLLPVNTSKSIPLTLFFSDLSVFIVRCCFIGEITSTHSLSPFSLGTIGNITFPCLIIHRAFKLDEDNALLTYVQQQLIPPTPTSSCTPPLQGVQDSIEEMPYQRNVRKVVHKISCTTSLLKLLVQVGSKVIESSVVYHSNV